MMEPKIVGGLEGHRAQGPVRRREQQPVRGVRERPTRNGAGAHLCAATMGNLDGALPWDVPRVVEHGLAPHRAACTVWTGLKHSLVSGTHTFIMHGIGRELTLSLEKGDQGTIKGNQKRRDTQCLSPFSVVHLPNRIRRSKIEYRRTATGGNKTRCDSEGAPQQCRYSAIAAAFGRSRKTRAALRNPDTIFALRLLRMLCTFCSVWCAAVTLVSGPLPLACRGESGSQRIRYV